MTGFDADLSISRLHLDAWNDGRAVLWSEAGDRFTELNADLQALAVSHLVRHAEELQAEINAAAAAAEHSALADGATANLPDRVLCLHLRRMLDAHPSAALDDELAKLVDEAAARVERARMIAGEPAADASVAVPVALPVSPFNVPIAASIVLAEWWAARRLLGGPPEGRLPKALYLLARFVWRLEALPAILRLEDRAVAPALYEGFYSATLGHWGRSTEWIVDETRDGESRGVRAVVGGVEVGRLRVRGALAVVDADLQAQILRGGDALSSSVGDALFRRLIREATAQRRRGAEDPWDVYLGAGYVDACERLGLPAKYSADVEAALLAGWLWNGRYAEGSAVVDVHGLWTYKVVTAARTKRGVRRASVRVSLGFPFKPAFGSGDEAALPLGDGRRLLYVPEPPPLTFDGANRRRHKVYLDYQWFVVRELRAVASQATIDGWYPLDLTEIATGAGLTEGEFRGARAVWFASVGSTLGAGAWLWVRRRDGVMEVRPVDEEWQELQRSAAEHAARRAELAQREPSGRPARAGRGKRKG